MKEKEGKRLLPETTSPIVEKRKKPTGRRGGAKQRIRFVQAPQKQRGRAPERFTLISARDKGENPSPRH